MASSPIILFSISAWIAPSTFGTVREILKEKGIQSETPANPSIGAEPPSKTFENDIGSLRTVLARLVEIEGRDIVVVAHSYGGAVASGAGQSLLDMLGGQYQPWMEVEGDYIRCAPNPEAAMHDLTPAEQIKWQAELLHTSPAVQEMMTANLGTELTYRLKSSHSPFLSVPGELADVLDDLSGSQGHPTRVRVFL
ncbi:alpha/beta hydrolase [Aspergillus undulatus]|uniref:alpha/beta hydrolase n=1 Tax=Aspergillus undulatus TaxID=1810928 RepID=UPI003CCD9CC9